MQQALQWHVSHVQGEMFWRRHTKLIKHAQTGMFYGFKEMRLGGEILKGWGGEGHSWSQGVGEAPNTKKVLFLCSVQMKGMVVALNGWGSSGHVQCVQRERRALDRSNMFKGDVGWKRCPTRKPAHLGMFSCLASMVGHSP